VNMATIERPRPRQSQRSGYLTLSQISRQAGVPVRPLVYLVDKAGIAPARRRGTSEYYKFEDIHELLAALDLPPDRPVSVTILRTAFRATVNTLDAPAPACQMINFQVRTT
jgi:hypothetical protein